MTEQIKAVNDLAYFIENRILNDVALRKLNTNYRIDISFDDSRIDVSLSPIYSIKSIKTKIVLKNPPK